MIPLTLGLDINIKHMHLQTFVRQDRERQGEETCQRSRMHRAPDSNPHAYAYESKLRAMRPLRAPTMQHYHQLELKKKDGLHDDAVAVQSNITHYLQILKEGFPLVS